MTVWYQVEFYSRLEQRWVPLFAKEKTREDALRRLDELLPGENGRVVKVTQTAEVVK